MRAEGSEDLDVNVAMEKEIDGLRARLNALGAASLRIGSSLDLQIVLSEVVESTRLLIGARYAAIATMDESGKPIDLVTSGFSEAEYRTLAKWSDEPSLFERFRNLDEPIRIEDVTQYLRDLGFSTERLPAGTFLGAPMRHQGQHVGNFYLMEKEDGEVFTHGDEELLLLFGTQAGAAIANARTHRAERLARANLETVVETCLVGVVVFDAATGSVESMNKEAARMVELLCTPGQTAEALAGLVTCRRADGREIALQELSLADVLSGAETVRAEEMELFNPEGGSSVSVLVNVTPLRLDDGDIKSVVVALQDMAPLRELERQRSDFLAMVSHELRAPLTSIKGSTATVLSGERVVGSAEIRQFFQIIDRQANRMDALIGDLLDAGRIESGTLSVMPEPTDVSMLLDQARNIFLTGGGRHRLLLDLASDLPQVLADRERIVQVISNLLANAARASPESSAIQIVAEMDGVYVSISVIDEGRGMAQAQLAQLFVRRAFSPDTGIARAPGGGLGLAICKGLVEAHGGRIRAESDGIGTGLRVTFTVPIAESRSIATTGKVTQSANHDRQVEEGDRPPILIVDDDPDTLRFVRDALVEAQFAPILTADPSDIEHIVASEEPRLVLLDLMLPGKDGIELMQTEPALADLPVIFISAYERDETIARAFEIGADDYIVKPFSPTELVARVRAALRRRSEPEQFVLGALSIDYDARRVSVDGREIELTVTEFDLLQALSLNAGRISTHDWLLQRVWAGRNADNPKIVRAYVKRLRRALGDDAANPKWIFNERGVGYRMPRP